MREYQTLIDAEALAGLLGHADLRLLDCRFDLGDRQSGAHAYAEGHLPGARYADLESDLSAPKRRAEDGRHPWPDADVFDATLGAWGITPVHQVIAYDAGDGAFAARAWCLLQVFGHRKAAVLDGGFARWQQLGLPTESALPVISPTAYRGRFDRSRLLDAEAVQAHLDSGGLLLDARAAARFCGEVEPIDAVAGHVPGARSRPYSENLEHGRFKSPARLATEFKQALEARKPEDLVAMCGSGVTACHHLLAMQHAGLRGGRLYAGSWSGWIADPTRPIAVG